MDRRNRSYRIEHWIAAFLMFAMAAIAFANVISRYLFHFSFAATEELTINMFVWLTVVGTGLAFERGGQLGMVTLYNLFPTRMKRSAIWVSALSGALLFAIVDGYTFTAIYDEITLFKATSAALDIPVWIYYSGVPILSVFVFAGIYRDARKRLQQLEEKH
jgi:TRAP-type C4-dicarboxylate transport system permease small subunit